MVKPLSWCQPRQSLFDHSGIVADLLCAAIFPIEISLRPSGLVLGPE